MGAGSRSEQQRQVGDRLRDTVKQLDPIEDGVGTGRGTLRASPKSGRCAPRKVMSRPTKRAVCRRWNAISAPCTFWMPWAWTDSRTLIPRNFPEE